MLKETVYVFERLILLYQKSYICNFELVFNQRFLLFSRNSHKRKMEATMTVPQCHGFNTLDDFLDSLITEELSNDSFHQVLAPKTEQINSMPTSPIEVTKTPKHKLSQLDSPGAMQTLTHSLENQHSPVLPKNNFGMPPSVMYSPPLSPECVQLNVPAMKPEENTAVMMFPAVQPQALPPQMQPVEPHPMMHAAVQGIPTFIGEKSFEKTYVYDPKPLTRKTRRALVPDEQKNQKYWMKRMRNNVAARKSREDRRRKELEVLESMKNLKDENQKMKTYIDTVVKANEQLVAEMMQMKHKLQQYENNATTSSKVSACSIFHRFYPLRQGQWQ